MKGIALIKHPLTIIALGLAVLPLAVNMIGMTDLAATKLAIFILTAIGFNVLLGYTGLVSFGHAMFFGLGAYAAALFQIHLAPDSFFAPLIFAVVFTVVLGVIVGALILRRRGVYFSLLTLAFTAMWFYLVYRWTSFTGGENGLRGVSRPTFIGLDLDNGLVFYYTVAALTFVSAFALWRLLHSPVGRVFLAIRDNEERCRFLGYRITWYKLISFTVSALFVGVAGALHAYLMYFVSADLISVHFAGEILAMAIIGGSTFFLGPAVGAVFYIVFQEWLSAYTASWQLWFGLLFVAIILFSPDGLMGFGERLLAPFRRHQEKAAAMAARIKPTLGPMPSFLESADGRSTGPALVARGISKRFGMVQAVADVDFEIAQGEMKVLIGPNGAGKTSLFNVLSGKYKPDGGTLTFQGKEIQRLPTERYPRIGISRSFQIINLFERLTVIDNVRLAVHANHRSRFNPWRRADRVEEVERETEELIRFIGLGGLEEVKVADLSGGGKRLLEIALSLASRPRVLLLDEPLAGLAAAERDRILSLIRTLSAHMAVLMVEHDIDRAFDIAGHVTVMHNGRIIADGDPRIVREHKEVQQVYLGRGTTEMQARPQREGQAGEPLLRLTDVNTFYGSNHILHDVSVELRRGEILGLLGRNGAGKSTTIKTVMGLAPPRSGAIFIGEDTITGAPPEKVSRLGVGYVPQGRRLFDNLSVADNLRLGRLRRHTGHGLAWSDEQIFEYFPKLKVLRERKAGVLSGGEKQMVAIARAMAGDVRLLMLDEPFEGLAPAVVDEVFDAVSRLREVVPVLIVEHDLDRVLALADRIYVLDNGKVVHEGPAQPLFDDIDYRKEILWV
jgi:branched-chain amino acid transport system ATP-binding protein